MTVSMLALRFVAVGSLILASGCDASGGTSPAAQDGGVQILMSDAIDVRGDTGIYVNNDGGQRTEITFPLAPDRLDVGYFHDVERIGTSGGLIAVLDAYGSRAIGQRCVGGRESWLRIFSLADKRQIEAIPVESCLDDLRAGDPPVTWQDDGFVIAGSQPRRYRIDGNRVAKLDEGAAQ